MDEQGNNKSVFENPGDVIPLLGATAESPAEDNPLRKEKPPTTAGERVHKWSTYLGVDWILNALTGVSFAYWAKYSDLGKKYWSEPLTKTFTKALSPFIKEQGQLQKSATYGNMFMSIIAGGMFTLPPLLVLESKKVKKAMIKSYDRMIYGKDKVDNDPKFQKAYDEIENAPKKDFWGGLVTRFIALAPLLAIVLIPSTKKLSNKALFNHVENASDAVARKMGFSPEKSFKMPVAQAKERWKFIHESVAMDFGLGVPYAILHSVFYNMVASHKGKAADVQKVAPTIEKPVASKRSAETESIAVPNPDMQKYKRPAQSYVERENDRANAVETPALSLK